MSIRDYFWERAPELHHIGRFTLLGFLTTFCALPVGLTTAIVYLSSDEKDKAEAESSEAPWGHLSAIEGGLEGKTFLLDGKSFILRKESVKDNSTRYEIYPLGK